MMTHGLECDASRAYEEAFLMRFCALSQSCVLSCGLLSASQVSFQCCHSFSPMGALETRLMGMVLGFVPTWSCSHLCVSRPSSSL